MLAIQERNGQWFIVSSCCTFSMFGQLLFDQCSTTLPTLDASLSGISVRPSVQLSVCLPGVRSICPPDPTIRPSVSLQCLLIHDRTDHPLTVSRAVLPFSVGHSTRDHKLPHGVRCGMPAVCVKSRPVWGLGWERSGMGKGWG